MVPPPCGVSVCKALRSMLALPRPRRNPSQPTRPHKRPIRCVRPSPLAVAAGWVLTCSPCRTPVNFLLVGNDLRLPLTASHRKAVARAQEVTEQPKAGPFLNLAFGAQRSSYVGPCPAPSHQARPLSPPTPQAVRCQDHRCWLRAGPPPPVKFFLAGKSRRWQERLTGGQKDRTTKSRVLGLTLGAQRSV